MAEEAIDINAMLEDAAAEAIANPNPIEGEAAKDAKDAKGDADKGEPEKAAAAEGADAGKDGGDKPEPYKPDDALIERAVRAGMSVADAKALPNAEMADRILTALEAKAEGATTKKADGEDGGEVAGVPDIDLSEFTEDNGYDPAMVKVLNSMKSVVEQQARQLDELRKAGESARAQDFFTAQFNGLDKAVRDHMDASRKSQLKSKFSMLEAGYKATNANVSREDVFKEALQLAAGDLLSRAEAEGKSAAAAKRKTLALARPGGNFAGNKGNGGPASEEDIADALFNALTN